MSDAGMPDAIWAWSFDLSQRNEFLHGGWCGDRDKKEVRYLAATPERDAAPDLLAALEELLRHYVDLANSGDAGFWDPEEEPQVTDARNAIAKARGKS